MYVGTYWKYSLLLLDFSASLEISRKIFEKHSNFMKILTVQPVLFHADEETDKHDETNNRFSQFSEGT